MTLKKGLTIDPGHQGIGFDPGAVNAKEGLYESEIVMEISMYQFSRFKELGVPVSLTRTGKKKMSNTERTNLVKSIGYQDCISNHINAGGGDGAEIIHSIHSNSAMAEKVLDALHEAGQNKRKVFSKRLSNTSTHDYYYMHRDTGEVQTLIVEYGFIDSPKDDIIQIKRDWKKYAEAVVKAYCEYRGFKYTPPKTASTPTPSPVKNSADDESIKWAVGNKIFDGTRLDEPATRRQVALMIHRMYKLLKG